MHLFQRIGILGIGRMSVGLAIDLGLKGLKVDMIDLKNRTASEKSDNEKGLNNECEAVARLFGRDWDPSYYPAYITTPPRTPYELIFEGLPEEMPIKQQAFMQMRDATDPETLICSMTSTFTVEELAEGMGVPTNIMVTHFMNPPYLIPFLEVVPHPMSSTESVEKLQAFLRIIGHMPSICQSSPGFIISRLQIALMNEAVRIMQEGVASPTDIDNAVKFGWGYRFPLMGILEFIDVGGLEILYHASHFVSKKLNRPDLVCPSFIEERYRDGAVGIKALKGIFEYKNDNQVKKNDQERLKKQVRLKAFLDQIHRDDIE